VLNQCAVCRRESGSAEAVALSGDPADDAGADDAEPGDSESGDPWADDPGVDDSEPDIVEADEPEVDEPEAAENDTEWPLGKHGRRDEGTAPSQRRRRQGR
jgi:hypothetical protein